MEDKSPTFNIRLPVEEWEVGDLFISYGQLIMITSIRLGQGEYYVTWYNILQKRIYDYVSKYTPHHYNNGNSYDLYIVAKGTP